MRMLGAFVNEELLIHCTAKAVFRKHPFYCALYHQVRAAGIHLGCHFCFLATGIARVGPVSYTHLLRR